MKRCKESLVKRIARMCSVAGLAALAAPVFASQLFTLSNGIFSSTALFTVSGTPGGLGSLTIVLTDTASAVPHDGSQLLSDLSFSISGNQAISTTTVTPTVALGSHVVTCTLSSCSVGGSPTANSWKLEANSGIGTGEFLLTGLAGHGKTLIMGTGTPSGGGSFGNADHHTFIQHSAIFIFANLAGVSSNSIISDVSFSFGTGPETVLPAAVSIPAAAWLFGPGLLALVAVARWRRCALLT